MIELIHSLLALDDYVGISENIDIAKGKYEMKLSIKEAWKHKKRYGSN